MIIAVCISKCVFMPIIDVFGCHSFALYPTVLPFITSQVILIRSVSLKRWKREWQTGQMRVAHLSVTVRSSLSPPVPSFHAPVYFPSTHISEFSLLHIHTHANRLSHVYTCKSAAAAASRKWRNNITYQCQNMYSDLNFFILVSIICYAYFSNYYLSSAMGWDPVHIREAGLLGKT